MDERERRKKIDHEEGMLSASIFYMILELKMEPEDLLDSVKYSITEAAYEAGSDFVA